MSDLAPQGPLAGIKVLDLTESIGHYCSKLMSDLGADVTLVEPVGGAAGRRQGPFLGNVVSLETSVPFTYYNAGKRGISVDLDSSGGRETVAKLAVTADLVIEGFAPGRLDALGLGWSELSAINPALVLTSITPYGQSGPYAAFRSEDITSLAMGGMLHLGGYHDSEPVAAYGNQANLAASQFAAVASMIALWSAAETGSGRHVDVSVQECVVMGLENAIQFYDLEGVVRKREAGTQRWAGMGVFDCLDGQVYLMVGGIVPPAFRRAHAEWMISEGVEGARTLLEPQWDDQDYQSSQEAKDIFASVFAPFAKGKSKDYLYTEGQARRIPICPINEPGDLIANPQLQHRGFFTKLEHRETGMVLDVPGAPYIMSRTPWQAPGPSPRLGEHTQTTLAGLGYDLDLTKVLFMSGAIR